MCESATRTPSIGTISCSDSRTEVLYRESTRGKEPVSLQGRPAVVLRFCIAPIGEERSATPVLRVDLRAYVRIPPHWTAHLAPLSRGKVTVANYEMDIECVPKLTSPFAPRDIERHSFRE
jgi:hypothetical protein